MPIDSIKIEFLKKFLSIIFLLLGANLSYAQSFGGLMAKHESNYCIAASIQNSSNIQYSQLILNICNPTDKAQQWIRDGALRKNIANGLCLASDGYAVYSRPCLLNDTQQQWDTSGLIQRHSSGNCLSATGATGTTLSMSPCSASRNYLSWDFGAVVAQGALNCKIKDPLGGYADSEGFTTSANGSLFTLGRLSWGGKTHGNFYLVQSNDTGLCLRRTGSPLTCNPGDADQMYRIQDASGAISIWTNRFIKFNPLKPKPVVDIFDNPNIPLQLTDVNSNDYSVDLFVGTKLTSNNDFGGAVIGRVLPSIYPYIRDQMHNVKISCEGYSDRTTQYDRAAIVEDYVLEAKYVQQEGARAIKNILESPLTQEEQSFLDLHRLYTPSLSSRTLKFYDLGAETNNDLSIKYIEAGAPQLYAHAQKIFRDLIPDPNAFANAVIASSSGALNSMEQGLNAVSLNSVSGRSMLETGGAQVGLLALQIRLPWALPSGLKKVPYLPSHGNFRISFPAIGPKANIAGGGSSLNHSYSDYRTNKADGVFNFVATVEIDKDIWTASRAYLATLPAVSGGMEFHFAFSVRQNGAGDKVRLDSISINAIADVASSGGVPGISGRIREYMGRNRILPATVREVQMGARPANFAQADSNLVDWLRPNDANLSVPQPAPGTNALANNLAGFTSNFYNNPNGVPLTVTFPASQLGQEPQIMGAVINAINKPKFNRSALIGGLINVIGEMGLSIKWFNNSFLDEANCRYNTPNDTTCKMNYRKFLDYSSTPQVIEPFAMGLVSSQLNFSWDGVGIPFWPSATPTLGVILPRVQFSGSSSYWIAFDQKSANAMRAGAGQITTYAN